MASQLVASRVLLSSTGLVGHDLHNFCSSPCIIWNDKVREDKMGRACSTNWEIRRILVGKPEGKTRTRVGE
jgi:hypothetical protein